MVKLEHSPADLVPEKSECIDYLRRNYSRLKVFNTMHPAPYADKYLKMKPEVILDEETSLYYTVFKGSRLYWKRGMIAREIVRLFSFLMLEQDSSSAHRYFDDNFIFKDKILFDVGSAEGIIVLDHIQELRHAYLFECDEGWHEVLSYTFKPYMDKVTVVSKYVSDCCSDDNVTIDDFVARSGVTPDIIKMDIEGYEEKALSGALETLRTYHPFVSCCLYHTPDGEEKITAMLDAVKYNCAFSPSYMFCCDCMFTDRGGPYLRHGVVRAS